MIENNQHSNVYDESLEKAILVIAYCHYAWVVLLLYTDNSFITYHGNVSRFATSDETTRIH